MEVFEYTDYKAYLRERLKTDGKTRGARSRLAKRLGCTQSYISQVLNAKVQISLEHAVEIDDFLGHSPSESQFFMLLVTSAKAATIPLQNYFKRQMRALIEERAKVSENVLGKRLSNDASRVFYSSWLYAAIHALLMVPGMTEALVTQRLGVSRKQVANVLEFLISEGLARKEGTTYVATTSRTHLPGDASEILKHHSNWRLRALNALDKDEPVNLHYSGPLALSRKNADLVRKHILSLTSKLEPIVAEPGEEDVYGIALDFFRV